MYISSPSPPVGLRGESPPWDTHPMGSGRPPCSAGEYDIAEAIYGDPIHTGSWPKSYGFVLYVYLHFAGD